MKLGAQLKDSMFADEATAIKMAYIGQPPEKCKTTEELAQIGGNQFFLFLLLLVSQLSVSPQATARARTTSATARSSTPRRTRTSTVASSG